MQEEIPLDSEIAKLEEYLRLNPRGIFSAKFGDGKSHMLNKFKEVNKDKYDIITLYPVNYQTSSNADIFELIKRDILIQLFMNDMITVESCEIKESELAQYELYNNLDSIFDLVKMTALAIHPSPEVIALGGVVEVAKKIRGISKRIKAKKKKLESLSKDSQLTDYLEAFEKKEGCIYEFDLVSNLIYQAVNASEKQTVLIIEDMDRLDPAHLFRILNVLAAHIDYRLIPKCQQDVDSEYPTNKFGFDNTLIVCDYENVEKIYRHIYGPTVDFDGYIKKYTTSMPYYYSFSEVVTEHLCIYIGEIVKQNSRQMRSILQSMQPNIKLEKLTIRRILNAINFAENYSNTSYLYFGNKHIYPASKSTIHVFLLLRQLGYTKRGLESFIDRLKSGAKDLNYMNSVFGIILLYSLPDNAEIDNYKFKIFTSSAGFRGGIYRLIINDSSTQLEFIGHPDSHSKFYEISPAKIAQRIEEIVL